MCVCVYIYKTVYSLCTENIVEGKKKNKKKFESSIDASVKQNIFCLKSYYK